MQDLISRRTWGLRVDRQSRRIERWTRLLGDERQVHLHAPTGCVVVLRVEQQSGDQGAVCHFVVWILGDERPDGVREGQLVLRAGDLTDARTAAVALAQALEAPLVDDSRPHEGERTDLSDPRPLELDVLTPPPGDPVPSHGLPFLRVQGDTLELPGLSTGARQFLLGAVLLGPAGLLGMSLLPGLAWVWGLLVAMGCLALPGSLLASYQPPQVLIQYRDGVLGVEQRWLWSQDTLWDLSEVERVVDTGHLVRVEGLSFAFNLGEGLPGPERAWLARWLGERARRARARRQPARLASASG